MELGRAKAALTPGPAAPPSPPAPGSPTSPAARLPPPYGLAAHLTREGTPEQREGARRAAATGRAAAAAPGSAAAALAHGLALQNLAAALGPARLEDQRALLLAACEVYDGAGGGAAICFNHGVALQDLAHAAGAPPAEAAASLAAAARQYAASLQAGPAARAAQALNNWALVLQELAGSAAPAARGPLRRGAAARFRAAMRAAAAEPRLAARFAYNLGTALYAHAAELQERAAAAASGAAAARGEDERVVRAAFAHAAQYVALSSALSPGEPAVERALTSVARLLPLPALRQGPVLLARRGAAGAEEWAPAYLALDAAALRAVRPPPSEAPPGGAASPVPQLALDVADVLEARAVFDPSLPPGAGLWLGLRASARGGAGAGGGLDGSAGAGLFLVAPQREDAEGWADALATLGALRRADAAGAARLQEELLARRPRRQAAPPPPPPA